VNQVAHVAVAYDQANGLAKFFVNGQLVASDTADIPLSHIQDVNNWLGRSNWPDPFFNGSILEFRIYNTVLADLEIAASASAGPDTPKTDAGTLQSIALNVETNM